MLMSRLWLLSCLVGVRVNNPNLENNPRLTLTPDIALCLYIVFPRDFDGGEAVGQSALLVNPHYSPNSNPNPDLIIT